MSRLTATELAKELSKFVNGAREDEVKELVQEMKQDHRTLQQAKMRMFCLYIEMMAEDTNTDPRNESSNKVAIAMVQGVKDANIQEKIDQDGFISDSLRKFIENEWLPSNCLPTI